jgi:lipoprotein-anchoring transpeptidase ErfK/SrfK
MRGPVKIASGGNGEETPVGHSLRVYRKEKDHLSQESRLANGQPAPMPWSVFFEDGGIAFHSGSPNRSSGGCIHLEPADAEAWFNYLQIGDQVQVVKAAEELAARKQSAAPPPPPTTTPAPPPPADDDED